MSPLVIKCPQRSEDELPTGSTFPATHEASVGLLNTQLLSELGVVQHVRFLLTDELQDDQVELLRVTQAASIDADVTNVNLD